MVKMVNGLQKVKIYHYSFELWAKVTIIKNYFGKFYDWFSHVFLIEGTCRYQYLYSMLRSWICRWFSTNIIFLRLTFLYNRTISWTATLGTNVMKRGFLILMEVKGGPFQASLYTIVRISENYMNRIVVVFEWWLERTYEWECPTSCKTLSMYMLEVLFDLIHVFKYDDG